MTKYNYVTIFNLNYLNRGLLLHKSLMAVAKNFDLYVICFDDATYNILKELNYNNLIPISLKEFEDEELLKIKPTRTAAEYCWTCSSASIWFCIKTFKLENCAYLDADMYFYSDPLKIWNENPNASVFITLHNYSPTYNQSKESGRFCVQFVGFKNTTESLKVLEEWRNNCINWCFNRIEDGKFGDQKYLDEWPEKYKEVHIVKDITAGLAPWNVDQFKITNTQSVINKRDKEESVPIFFHFHGLKVYQENVVSYTSHRYFLSKDVQNKIYLPYVKSLLVMDEFLRKIFKEKYDLKHEDSGFAPIAINEWLRFYLYDVRNDLKNINANFTKDRFKNNYTQKIKI